MQFSRTLLPIAILGGLAITTTQVGAADDTTEVIKALKQQVEELAQKVRALERKDELDNEASVEKAKSAATVSIGQGGLQVRSADSKSVFDGKSV